MIVAGLGESVSLSKGRGAGDYCFVHVGERCDICFRIEDVWEDLLCGDTGKACEEKQEVPKRPHLGGVDAVQGYRSVLEEAFPLKRTAERDALGSIKGPISRSILGKGSIAGRKSLEPSSRCSPSA